MKVSSIKLTNFRRFTDLVIKNIPETAKLVLVVGPNGSGKSSLFDALINWYRIHARFPFPIDDTYYQKHKDPGWSLEDTVSVTIHGDISPKKGSLYVRTAYRNDSDFSVNAFNIPDVPSENIRVSKVIENDQTVSLNYQRLIYDTMAGVYNLDNDMKSVKDLRDELIGKVRNSMKAVFGDLLLKDIADPTQGGAFFFERGTVKKYHYKNLSGGEKGAFDILLDLHVKKQYFDDAIYCIDEIETHLHTRVQGKLLKEMVAVLPQKSQLWITTHSLGVMRAALELEKEQPGSVSIIDFDGIDPDVPREIEPSNIGRATWDKLLSIALDDLSVMVAPNHVVVCEGSSIGSRRKDFDAEIYNKIFRQSTNSVIFVSGGGSEQVKATGVSVGNTIAAILPGSKVYSLTDRDDRSDDEVQRLRQEGQLILDQRNMESYLFSDEVIEALVKTSNRIENETTTTTESFSTELEALIDQALEMKRQAIEESISRGNPADDLKSASGPIFTSLKRLLQLTRCGNNKDEFMRDTLAPLITPTMSCYQDLKTCILDQML